MEWLQNLLGLEVDIIHSPPVKASRVRDAVGVVVRHGERHRRVGLGEGMDVDWDAKVCVHCIFGVPKHHDAPADTKSKKEALVHYKMMR